SFLHFSSIPGAKRDTHPASRLVVNLDRRRRSRRTTVATTTFVLMIKWLSIQTKQPRFGSSRGLALLIGPFLTECLSALNVPARIDYADSLSTGSATEGIHKLRVNAVSVEHV